VSTKYPDLWAALAEPFEPHEVKQLTKGRTTLHYVTARTVMNRLDSVLGPENWWDEYVPQEHSVLCKLTLRLPDGSTITKCDAGGYAGMADQGDDDKSGYSDAFKRAAAKFGVMRYLYKDGVPQYDAPAPEPEAVAIVQPKFSEWLEQAAPTAGKREALTRLLYTEAASGQFVPAGIEDSREQFKALADLWRQGPDYQAWLVDLLARVRKTGVAA